MRRLVALLLPALLVVGSGAGAWASWGSVGSGSSYTWSDAVPQVTGLEVDEIDGGDVTLSWNPATMADGSEVDAYRVHRDGTDVACDTVTATTCTDEGLDEGTYSYTVVAHVGSAWVGPPSSAVEAVVEGAGEDPDPDVDVEIVLTTIERLGPSQERTMTVVVEVQVDGVPVEGASVEGQWSRPSNPQPTTVSSSCTTDDDGRCEVQATANNAGNAAGVTFTVTNIVIDDIDYAVSVESDPF
jgi:hypothetical protein